MDFSGIAARLGNIISDDPIWKLRRAALHTEIGEYVTATKLIAEATAELERRYRLDRNSLSIKSQLGWASWLSRATAVWSTRWDDLPQPRDFAALDIDPPAEIESMERTAADIEEKRREMPLEFSQLLRPDIIVRDRAEFTSAPEIRALSCSMNSTNLLSKRACRCASITSISAQTQQSLLSRRRSSRS